MAAILTSNASVIAAENFITSIYENDTNLYMGVGKGLGDYRDVNDDETIVQPTPRTGENGGEVGTGYDEYNRWYDEYTPPTPTDRTVNISNFLKDLIGIKKILPSNIMLVVPRNNWERGKIYNPLQPGAISGKRAQDYYCLTTSEPGNNCVWVCIAKENNATTTQYEPTLAYKEPGNEEHGEDIGYHYIANNTVKCADGYTWMFLYNITSTIINAGLLLDNWMPVPFNHHGSDRITSEIHTSGALMHYGGTLTDTQITYGDCNANRTLGAYRILVTCTLANEGSAIPYESIYRQVGLLVDPRGNPANSTSVTSTPGMNVTDGNGPNETATTPPTGPARDNAYDVTSTYSQYPQNVMGPRLTGDRYAASDVDLRYENAQEMMGNPVQVIYLENKKPIMREESQSEKLEIILVF